MNEGRFHESKDGKDEKVFDALEWLAAMTSHLPNKGEQMVRYYGHYGNASRGLQQKKNLVDGRTYEEGTSLSPGRSFLTDYPHYCMINPSPSRLLSLSLFGYPTWLSSKQHLLDLSEGNVGEVERIR